MKIAYFDCFMGISGDMTLGALIDVGADAATFRERLSSLGIGGYKLEITKRITGGVEATDVNVLLEAPPHTHRRLSDILGIIDSSGLSARVRETAGRIFLRLANAEARVHGCTPEEVHFHEVGAVDAIVDIVGSVLLLELLNWPKVIASPMPTFYGYTNGAHGVIPLPAPATAEILRGVPWQKLDIEGELVTPTGAAIIAELAADFGHLPQMTVDAVGYGAGKSDFGTANVLRVMLGEETQEDLVSLPSVSVVETNIDDLNPEFYEPVMEKLFAAGALDVFMTPIIMKKNRPGVLLAAICEPGRAKTIADIILSETSTFGVRISVSQRVCLERHRDEITTEFGNVGIKVGERNGRIVTASPEYEDCKKAANAHAVSIRLVYETALAAFRKQSARP
ncbi:MAG: nickel pincer cofactor biosynthesis protein LarC [Syntrophobacterales bacterium]|nr:nickel pincer cofactor biosynthesis protein LarC [Syntrophobacterales bacterium]